MAERRHDIDWLRIGAVVLLFDFHTARIFDEGGFYVKNQEVSVPLDIFVKIVGQWHMPLFFLVSGVATFYALRFRSDRRYVIERFKRLFIPLLFGTFVIIPPQVYCRLLSEPGYDKNYLAFYPDFFKGVAPAGNFEWGHLWFLAYLFAFSLLALPIFNWLKSSGGPLLDGLERLAEKRGGIFLFALPVALLEAALRTAYPNGNQNLVNDWANFFTYIIFFIYGYIIFSRAGFSRAIQKHWRVSGVMAALFTMGLAAWALTGGVDPYEEYHFRRVLFDFLRGFNTWFWLILFLGAAREYLDFGGRVKDYANQAVLPVYILHQTVIVVIGFYAVRFQANLYLKFIFIDLAGFFAVLFLYDVLVRRIGALRFLFGMRPDNKDEPRTLI